MRHAPLSRHSPERRQPPPPMDNREITPPPDRLMVAGWLLMTWRLSAAAACHQFGADRLALLRDAATLG